MCFLVLFLDFRFLLLWLVWPCSACASELPTPIPLLPDCLEDKTVRLSRLGLQNIEVTEAMVTEIEGCRPSCSIVHLEIRAAPPAFCMGDLLVLESLDGGRQWEADVRSDAQWKAHGRRRSDPDSKFDDSHNGSRSISVYVRTAEANSDPKSMAILVELVQDSTCHLTDNGRGAALSKASKATVNETRIDAVKPKIKIGIHGYGSTGRAMARIALESKDVELVAINDSSITMDQMTCMFRDSHDQWLSSNFKIKDGDHNTLMFGDKEVTIFRFKEPRKIPWKEVGAEYIVEVLADKSSAHYYKILHDTIGEVEDVACRAPVLEIMPPNPNAAKEPYFLRKKSSLLNCLFGCCGLADLIFNEDFTHEDLRVPHVGDKRSIVSEAKTYYKIEESMTGECFYRAFIYSYLELVLENDDQSEETRLLYALENVSVACMCVEWLCDDFGKPYMAFKELIEKIKSWKTETRAIRRKLLLAYFRDYTETEAIFSFLRISTAAWLLTHPELSVFYAPEDGTTLEEHCRSEIIRRRSFADHIAISALSDALGIHIQIFSFGIGGNTYATPSGESNTVAVPVVSLVYTGIHYDILYPI